MGRARRQSVSCAARPTTSSPPGSCPLACAAPTARFSGASARAKARPADAAAPARTRTAASEHVRGRCRLALPGEAGLVFDERDFCAGKSLADFDLK